MLFWAVHGLVDVHLFCEALVFLLHLFVLLFDFGLSEESNVELVQDGEHSKSHICDQYSFTLKSVEESDWTVNVWNFAHVGTERTGWVQYTCVVSPDPVRRYNSLTWVHFLLHWNNWWRTWINIWRHVECNDRERLVLAIDSQKVKETDWRLERCLSNQTDLLATLEQNAGCVLVNSELYLGEVLGPAPHILFNVP
jgi:hypothetical protein